MDELLTAIIVLLALLYVAKVFKSRARKFSKTSSKDSRGCGHSCGCKGKSGE